MAPRILVVEDNPVTQKMLHVALVSGGYEVADAYDARAALESATTALPALVLLDLVLPDLDGVELLARLRSLPGAAALPIVALSGFTSRFGEARTLEAGFTALLPKPIETTALLDAVRTHLPQESAAAASASTGRRLLIVDDDAIQLKLARLQFSQFGFDVVVASGAVPALAAARAERPAAILSDVFMPDIDGFQLCLDVRHDPKLADVPIVLMSNTYGSQADRDLARRVGANAFVARTPSFEEAAQAIDLAIGRPVQQAGEVPSDALRLKHAQLVIQQLERHVGTLTGMAQRCALQSAQISLLSGVADALTHDTDTDVALRDVLAATLDAAGISKGALLLLSESSGELKLRQAIGFSELECAGLSDFFGYLPMLSRFIHDGVSVSIPSGAIPESIAHVILGGCGVATLHIVPLSSDGGRVGAMVIGATHTDMTTSDSVAFARAMGNQLAQSLALARTVSMLAASEKRYRALLHNASDAIATLSPDGVLRGINRRWEEILGRPESEVVGHHLREFAPPGRAGDNVKAFVEQQKPGAGRPAAVPVSKADGSIVWMEFSQASLEIDGEPIVFAIGRDVTEQRQLEEQLRQAQKLEAVGQLAGGVAHDFNNVLTAILGFTQLLLAETSVVDDRRELLQEIKKAGDRAAGLTRQLLAFSRKQILQPELIDVNERIAAVRPMLRHLLREHIELAVAPGANLRLVRIDPGQLEQILINLAVNAADAMPNGGRLTIETANVTLSPQHPRRLPAAPGSYVMLAVTDTGVGMDPKTLNRIFEPFFTTKEIGKGTGLGLSTVYGIVKQSGGDIWVYSEPGVGSTFKIYLPTVEGSLPPAAQETQQAVSPTGSETILLVEDDDSVRALSRVTLESAGYRVLQANSPLQAVRVATEWGKPIHLLLSDVIMPESDGPPLFDRLSATHPGLRVLYMSGYTDEAVVRQGLLKEGTPFLQKPFAPDALSRRVREVLSDPSPRS